LNNNNDNNNNNSNHNNESDHGDHLCDGAGEHNENDANQVEPMVVVFEGIGTGHLSVLQEDPRDAEIGELRKELEALRMAFNERSHTESDLNEENLARMQEKIDDLERLAKDARKHLLLLECLKLQHEKVLLEVEDSKVFYHLSLFLFLFLFLFLSLLLVPVILLSHYHQTALH
jgi:hypothetical protein